MSPPLDARCGAVPMPWRVAAWAVAGRCPAAKEVMHVYRKVSTATLWLLTPFVILFGWAWFDSSQAAEPAINSGASPTWQHLSTETGDLPPPSDSTQQVMTLVLDVDQDGDNDFVIGARRAPGPVSYTHLGLVEKSTRNILLASCSTRMPCVCTF